MWDAYDYAVDYLTRHPDKIGDAWRHPSTHRAGVLFGYVTKSRKSDSSLSGCLTLVRLGMRACTPELTRAIRSDDRLPQIGERTTVADLPVFAEWQRRLDRDLGRRPPKVSWLRRVLWRFQK